MFLITTLMHSMMVLLPCMNLKLDVIIKILNLGYVLCYLKSYYITQTSKYFFPDLRTRPLYLYLSLCMNVQL